MRFGVEFLTGGKLTARKQMPRALHLFFLARTNYTFPNANSDNGAFYEDDHWARFFTPTHTPEMIFNQLKAYHAELGINVGTYQLDPWWSDGPGSGPSWYWAWNWTAYPGYFPAGLAALGLPLTLYSNLWAPPPINNMTQWSWVTSEHGSISGSAFAHILPEESVRFKYQSCYFKCALLLLLLLLFSDARPFPHTCSTISTHLSLT